MAPRPLPLSWPACRGRTRRASALASHRRPISAARTAPRLRIAEKAYEDLKVPASERGDIDKLAGSYGIIGKFRASFVTRDPSSAHVVKAIRERIRAVSRDHARPDLEDVVVKRVRHDDATGAWRAPTWWEATADTVWLCRAKRISDYPSEEALYDALADLHERGELLPTPKERALAVAEAVQDKALEALRVALAAAHDAPERWVEATVAGRGSIGAAVVISVEEEDGSWIERTVVVARRLTVSPGHDIPLAQRARLELSDPHGVAPMTAARQIPAGRALRDGEVPLVQEVIVEH